uniref:Uncharacterized protein n=1 Tax=Aegilops tauschii subsp. strangulata TaxID=200361 RepID=A0A453CZD7_AEGTS
RRATTRSTYSTGGDGGIFGDRGGFVPARSPHLTCSTSSTSDVTVDLYE